MTSALLYPVKVMSVNPSPLADPNQDTAQQGKGNRETLDA
jgi:hypothetical protein